MRRVALTLGAFSVIALTASALVSACGPGMQFIYEGNIRFEHCYRLDYDPKIAPSHRKACWQDWLRRFPRAQTRDRLEYARQRIAMLAAGQGATLTLDLHLPADDGGVSIAPNEPAIVPTNAHAPPPARSPIEAGPATNPSGVLPASSLTPGSAAGSATPSSGPPAAASAQKP